MAKKFVEEYLPMDSKQILQTKMDDARGKFGRILGEFVIETEWEGTVIPTTVNEQLIRKHHGVKYHDNPRKTLQLNIWKIG